MVEANKDLPAGSRITATEGVGIGIAEIVGLGQIAATGTRNGLLIFALLNLLVCAVLLVQAWRRRAYRTALVGTVVLALAAGVAGGFVDHLAFAGKPSQPGGSGQSATPAQTGAGTPATPGNSPTVSPSASNPSTVSGGGELKLSSRPLPPPQGVGNLAATSVQIGSATFPDSIRFRCSPAGFGSGSITYDVAGYKFLNTTVGVPNDATNGVGNTATITFFKDGTTQLGTPLTIVVGQPQTVHLDLQGTTQLQIQCAAKGPTGNGAAMDIALGDATLVP